MKIRDRIKGFVRLDPRRIRPNPNNWRVHPDEQRNALRGVLSEIGVVDDVLVWPVDAAALAELRRVTSDDAFQTWLSNYTGDFMLVDGHLRTEELSSQPVPALVLDIDEREAAEVLATHDPIAAMAQTNRELYARVAAEFNSTSKAIQELVASVAALDTDEPTTDDPEDTGAPDQSEAAKADFVILVECESEADQLEKIDRFLKEGIQCRALT